MNLQRRAATVQLAVDAMAALRLKTFHHERQGAIDMPITAM